MIREAESRFITRSVQSSRSCSVIGLSNMGKSSLLRELCSAAVRQELLQNKADDYLFVYVDCNLMASRTEQALHEATLRNVISTLRRAGVHDQLLKNLMALHQEVVQPGTPIRSPLAFDSAVRLVCEESERMLVLLFDEFDEPFEKLDGRVFLNLRAMKDAHAGALNFVTATEKPLHQIRSDNDSNEFAELFSTREVWLGFVNRDDAREIAAEAAEGAPIEKAAVNFIISAAGGHAGLIKAVTETWLRIAAGIAEDAREDAERMVMQALDSESNVRSECVRIWMQLQREQQDALVDLIAGRSADRESLDLLRTMRLTNAGDASDGGEGGNEVLIGSVWRGFVRRQGLTRPGVLPGVHVDVDSGDVHVDGHTIEPLTELEYKLLLLLYGKLNKIVDKYAIVTNVWGANYIDNIDDARIEKLVSRLRSKLEPNILEPRYLLTLRGRGYKLVGKGSAA
ncbi:MAG: winged helix-turn-helix domain-containing protein [Chloroflexi bacterium]|nr:winged helix-turn-helix domain-containing protein [Chloroflexota bacterium]